MHFYTIPPHIPYTDCYQCSFKYRFHRCLISMFKGNWRSGWWWRWWWQRRRSELWCKCGCVNRRQTLSKLLNPTTCFTLFLLQTSKYLYLFFSLHFNKLFIPHLHSYLAPEGPFMTIYTIRSGGVYILYLWNIIVCFVYCIAYWSYLVVTL